MMNVNNVIKRVMELGGYNVKDLAEGDEVYLMFEVNNATNFIAASEIYFPGFSVKKDPYVEVIYLEG